VRQTIKALTWITTILWIIALALPVTVGFSLMELAKSNFMAFREPTMMLSHGNFSLSAPFYLNNTGFYDLSDISVKVTLESENKTISTFSKTVENIPAGSILNSTYDFSISLEELISKNKQFLTEDTEINLDISGFFRIAYLIGFGSATNITMMWGAPFHNLTLSEIHYNSAAQKFSFQINFKNHASFTVNGPMKIEIYNNKGIRIGSIIEYLNVPSDTPFHILYELTMSPSNITDNGVILVYFENIKILERESGWSG